MAALSCLITPWDWRDWPEVPLPQLEYWWIDLVRSAAAETSKWSSCPLFLVGLDSVNGLTTLTDCCTSSKVHLPCTLQNHSNGSSRDGRGKTVNMFWLEIEVHQLKPMNLMHCSRYKKIIDHWLLKYQCKLYSPFQVTILNRKLMGFVTFIFMTFNTMVYLTYTLAVLTC